MRKRSSQVDKSQLLLHEIETLPEASLGEVVDFAAWVKRRETPQIPETMLLSEVALSWDSPEEDAAWVDLPGDDVTACQITSKSKSDPFALPIAARGFVSGGLPVDSFIRPSKIFTAGKGLVLAVASRLTRRQPAPP